MIYKAIYSSVLILLLTGCNSYKNVNMYEKNNLLEKNEKNLVNSSTKLSNAINDNENTIKDSNYNEYPNNILKKMLSDDNLNYPDNITFNIKIIKNPSLNAFALPNGSIYIHSGILSKIENEAQLALLIGHEMSHVVHKHTLKQRENNKTSATISQLFGLVTAPFDAGILSLLLHNSSMSGYSQEHEKEADQKGFEQIVKAGYDPKEASKLFDLLLKDIELNEIEQPYFFSSHPKVEERITNSKEIIDKKYKNITGVVNKENFQTYVKPILIENIETELKLKKFKSAQYSINELYKRNISKSTINYLEAELIRLEKKKDSFDSALEKYRLSIKNDENNSKAYRGIGYLFYQKNKNVEAKNAFEKYLALNDKAEDKAYIMHYIKQCEKKEKDEKLN